MFTRRIKKQKPQGIITLQKISFTKKWLIILTGKLETCDTCKQNEAFYRMIHITICDVGFDIYTQRLTASTETEEACKCEAKKFVVKPFSFHYSSLTYFPALCYHDPVLLF